MLKLLLTHILHLASKRSFGSSKVSEIIQNTETRERNKGAIKKYVITEWQVAATNENEHYD